MQSPGAELVALQCGCYLFIFRVRVRQIEEITAQPITWVLVDPIITPASPGSKPHSLAPQVSLPLTPTHKARYLCSSPDPCNSDPRAWKMTVIQADHKALGPLQLPLRSLVLAPFVFSLLRQSCPLPFPHSRQMESWYSANLEQRERVLCISSCRCPGPTSPPLPSRPHSSH